MRFLRVWKRRKLRKIKKIRCKRHLCGENDGKKRRFL